MEQVTYLVYGLTVLATVLFVWQFFGKKGTPGHMRRGLFVLLFSACAVLINTTFVSSGKGIEWDGYYLFHFTTGILFFVGLLFTIVLGIGTTLGGTFHRSEKFHRLKKIHRIAAHFTGVVFLLSMLGAIAIRFLR